MWQLEFGQPLDEIEIEPEIELEPDIELLELLDVLVDVVGVEVDVLVDLLLEVVVGLLGYADRICVTSESAADATCDTGSLLMSPFLSCRAHSETEQ